MNEHIIGLEMEYSLVSDSSSLTNAQVAMHFVEIAKKFLPTRAHNTEFFPAAGRIYYDNGHVERASPECRNIRQTVAYDKAGDRFITQVAAETEQQLKKEGYLNYLEIAKTTVDPTARHAFGCHENYQIERQPALLHNANEFQHYLFRCLFPFLVSRSIICGSGLHDGQRFCLAQRSRFINVPVSTSTTAHQPRPIINTRDEPLGDKFRFKRLHLIMGDANLADWANFLKVGTTALVLEMAEDCYLSGVPVLENPVTAFHTIADDPGIAQLDRTELTAKIPLRNGKSSTALELQHYYLASAKAYYSKQDIEAQEIIRYWQQTLEDLEKASEQLFDLLVGKLDWVTKKWMLLELCSRHKHSWSDERCAINDHRYHVIYPVTEDESMFHLLENKKIMVPLITSKDLEDALHYPPHFTRARARAEALLRGATADWVRITTPDFRDLYLNDAFDWCPVTVLRQLGASDDEFLTWFNESLCSGNTAVRIETLRKLSQLPSDARSVSGITTFQLARQGLDDHDPSVRAAAVEALGKFNTKQAVEALKLAVNDIDPIVRLQATRASSNR